MGGNDGRKKFGINVSLTMEMAPDSALFGRNLLVFVLSNSRNSLCPWTFFRFKKGLYVIRPLGEWFWNDKASILRTMFSIDMARGFSRLALLSNLPCCSCYSPGFEKIF